MQFILFVLGLVLLFPSHLEAKSKSDRKPANRFPTMVTTFICKEAPDQPEAALGLISMSIDVRDSSTGTYAMNLFVRAENRYVVRTLNGRFNKVPGGIVYQGIMGSALTGESVRIHLHPAEKTLLPGLYPAPLSCEPSASLSAGMVIN
jgi:hypothetical protein